MANPKYQDLPYIASEEPDVYETDDLPESEQANAEDEQEGLVERLLVDPKDAYTRFNKATVDSTSADFSDSVNNRNRKSGFAVQYEVLPIGELEGETVLQKLQRLKCEVKELEDTAKINFAEPDISPAAVLAEVEKLQNQLGQFTTTTSTTTSSLEAGCRDNSLPYNQLLSQLKNSQVKKGSPAKKTAGADGCITYELHYKPEISESAKLSVLEARINQLEGTIGSRSDRLSNLCDSTTGQTLMDAVAVLSSKIQLLDEDKVEKLTARLQLLLQSLGKVEEGKGADAEGLEKVNELYELVKKWDAHADSLPQVVDRLYTLQDLHQQAMEFSSSLKALETAQSGLSQTLTSHNELLSSVQGTFAKNVDTIGNNMGNLEKRMAALKK